MLTEIARHDLLKGHYSHQREIGKNKETLVKQLGNRSYLILKRENKKNAGDLKLGTHTRWGFI